MNRLAGIIYTHTRSINVMMYANRVVYEIPLMYNETISAAKPTIEVKDKMISISFPNIESGVWTKSQSSQNVSTSSILLQTKNLMMWKGGFIVCYRICYLKKPKPLVPVEQNDLWNLHGTETEKIFSGVEKVFSLQAQAKRRVLVPSMSAHVAIHDFRSKTGC